MDYFDKLKEAMQCLETVNRTMDISDVHEAAEFIESAYHELSREAMNKPFLSIPYCDGLSSLTPFGEIDIIIRSVNKDDLQKLRDIIIDFYEGLATMAQNMGDEVSTYGFYAEDRQSNQIDCKHYLNELKVCELYGGKCEHKQPPLTCAMYEPYPF